VLSSLRLGATVVPPTAASATSLSLVAPTGLADGAHKVSVDGSEDRSGDGQIASLQDPVFTTLYNFRGGGADSGCACHRPN
jgi:hypothetical protein